MLMITMSIHMLAFFEYIKLCIECFGIHNACMSSLLLSSLPIQNLYIYRVYALLLSYCVFQALTAFIVRGGGGEGRGSRKQTGNVQK
jgi:hypothetical protein